MTFSVTFIPASLPLLSLSSLHLFSPLSSLHLSPSRSPLCISPLSLSSLHLSSLALLLCLTGSPLQFYVDYVNSGNVSAYGPGLIHGTVNKPAVFTVNTKDAGEGRTISRFKL